MHACMHTYAYITYIHSYMTFAYVHTHAYIQTHTYACIHTQTCRQTCIRIHRRPYTRELTTEHILMKEHKGENTF
jgi:hypothetical protein